MYNSRADPVEHVSQFNQRMAIHSKNEVLMCKVFPSSLGSMVMRWFDGLRPNSINSFKQLTQAFRSHFITSSKVPRPLDSLLSLSMREGETLKAYSDKYWEMYNEIEGDYDDVAISTFKSGFLTEHGLRKSLMGKPIMSLRQLMDRIDKYKRVEEDQQLGKVVAQKRRDFQSDRFNNNNNRPKGDFAGQSRPVDTICSKTQYIRSWKRSRMNHSSNSRIRWQEIPRSATRTCIANTTKNRGTPLRTTRT